MKALTLKRSVKLPQSKYLCLPYLKLFRLSASTMQRTAGPAEIQATMAQMALHHEVDQLHRSSGVFWV